MIVFPNAKINLGLRVTARRPDGYHDLDTVFVPIALKDALEVVECPQGEGCRLHVAATDGTVLDCADADNLVARAYRLLVAEGYTLPPVEVWLTKHIPSGAGLGGGSADAAFMLLVLRQMFRLPIADDVLALLAGRLGADCPFFIFNRPLHATGTGDCFAPLPCDPMAGLRAVVVKPPVFVSTAEAFRHIVPALPDVSLPQLLTAPAEEWRHTVTNDFETTLFPLHPELPAIKQRLYDLGAVYASMSGSGSALYGLFASDAVPTLPTLRRTFPGCGVFSL